MRYLPWTCILFVVPLCSPAVSADTLRAGVATVDITPPVPYRMSGYFSERLSTGVMDPLQAKALVLSQADTQAAIVCCDLIGMDPAVSRRVRELASISTKIPVANITICATHSHTGPLYWGALREFFHERAIARQGQDIHEQVNYPEQLVGQLVRALEAAHANQTSARLAAGYASEGSLSFNRRFHMRDGSVRFNPGQQNPDIVSVAGPIDPQVGIVSISGGEAVGSKPLAAIISFALHLDTVGGTAYSADYPRYLEERLRRDHGPAFVSLFGAGTCGDINHIDVRIKTRRSAAEIGATLGAVVADSLPRLEAVAQPLLAVRGATVQVPLQEYSPERIAQAQQDMEFVDDGRKLSFLERVETFKINALQLRKAKQLALEVQVFRLGNDVAIVTLPGEVFVELGIAIKSASPFATTLVMELANDAPGYIPTKKAFAEGSYETVNSRITPGGGELMVDTAIRLLRELK